MNIHENKKSSKPPISFYQILQHLLTRHWKSESWSPHSDLFSDILSVDHRPSAHPLRPHDIGSPVGDRIDAGSSPKCSPRRLERPDIPWRRRSSTRPCYTVPPGLRRANPRWHSAVARTRRLRLRAQTTPRNSSDNWWDKMNWSSKRHHLLQCPKYSHLWAPRFLALSKSHRFVLQTNQISKPAP